MTDEIEMVKVRKVGGLARVDIPGGPRGVEVGDVVDVPEDRARTLVAGGEFEWAHPAGHFWGDNSGELSPNDDDDEDEEGA